MDEHEHACGPDRRRRPPRPIHARWTRAVSDAQHFIIAHSHGGNVALYAMRDPAAREVVKGIVTLGAPFIYARRRDPRSYADAIAWLMLGVAALVPFVLLDALNLAWIPLAWLAGAVVLIVTMKPRLSRWVRETATREQADIVAALQPPSIDRSKLAILCARGDEARRWLRTWDVAAQSAVVIGCALLSIVAVAVRSNLPATVDGLAQSALHSGLDEMRVFGFDGWALTVGVVVLCVIWAVAVMCSSLVRWPGYWREPLLANVLVEIGSDSVPRAGSHAVHTFDVPAPTVRGWITSGNLRHKAICDERAVVSAIGNWIGYRLRPGEEPRLFSRLPQRASCTRSTAEPGDPFWRAAPSPPPAAGRQTRHR